MIRISFYLLKKRYKTKCAVNGKRSMHLKFGFGRNNSCMNGAAHNQIYFTKGTLFFYCNFNCVWFSIGDDLRNCSFGTASTLSRFVFTTMQSRARQSKAKQCKGNERKGIKIKFNAYMLFHA